MQNVNRGTIYEDGSTIRLTRVRKSRQQRNPISGDSPSECWVEILALRCTFHPQTGIPEMNNNTF